MSLLQHLGRLARGKEDAEEGLVTAAQQGDRRAFDSLARTHQTLLRGFLTRRVGPDAVEDVLQETWLACWSALPRFSRRSRFKAWLFSIALHKVQDHHRTCGRTPTEALSDLPDSEAVMPGDPYAAVDLRHAVQSVLAQLPAAQREVVEMYYYAELTLPEIAEALGRNQNTVKYQFYRAHAQVADGLDPREPQGRPGDAKERR